MPSTATASPAPRRGRRSSALLLLLCALLLLLSLRDSGAATAPSPEPTTNGQEQDEAAASSSSSPSSSALPLPPASSVWCPLSDDRSVQQLADELIAALDLPSPTDAASAAEAEAGRAAAMRSATAQFASHRCPPDMGDWIIDNPVPEQDVSALAYTSRDWLRWDGFDPSSTAGSDWFYTPPTFGETPKSDTVWGIDTPSRPLDLSLPSNVSTAARVTVGASGKLTPALYLRAVRSTFIDTFWIKAYKTFRSYSRNPTLDFVQQFHVKKDLDFIGPLMNASFAINENYNIFRTARKSAMRTSLLSRLRSEGVDPATRPVDDLVDAEFDALRIDWLKDMPRNRDTAVWYQLWIDAVMSKQNLQPGVTFASTRGGATYDTFGLFEGLDAVVGGASSGYNIELAHFKHGEWAFLAGHYLKFMNDQTLRKIRRSMYASAAAQHVARQMGVGGKEPRLANQWILRLLGWSATAYTLQRSEAILRQRGTWMATDGYATTTSWARGEIASADLVNVAHQELDKFVSRFKQHGVIEYLSTYYGYGFLMLGQGLLHAPSQHCYDQFERIWKMYWFDLNTHWFPGASAFSGPSSRHYDMITGVHGRADKWDALVFLRPLYPPSCVVEERRRSGDGTVSRTHLNLCTVESNRLPRGEPSIWSEENNVLRLLHTAQLCGGVGWLPYDPTVSISLRHPYRIAVSKVTEHLAQARYNFVSPQWTIGFGGEEPGSNGMANTVVARLAGTPNPGTPVAMVKQREPTRVHAFVRLMSDATDTPFHKTSEWADPGHEQNQLSRFVNVQHQGFLLTTALVAGRPGRATPQSPWNTDILVPLTVDTILADDVPLPRTVGSVVALPPHVILTVRHRQASIVVRILRFDTSPYSPMLNATSIRTIPYSAKYAPGAGLQEYTLQWQVDTPSLILGCGRITLHHKHRDSDTATGAYRVATLWAAAHTASDREMHALQRTVRHARWQETLRLSNWSPTDQPWSGNPSRAWDGKSVLGSGDWLTEVTVGGVQLRVDRRDVYQPNHRDAAYTHINAPLNLPPYQLTRIERTVDGTDPFARFFDPAVAGATRASQGIQYEGVAEAQLLQPHVDKPLVCDPRLDAPCWRWEVQSEGACSVTCGTGVRVRTLRCTDAAAASGPLDPSGALCPTHRPATSIACVMRSCLPLSAPRIIVAEAADRAVVVWFEAAASATADRVQHYDLEAQPTGLRMQVAVTAVGTPVRIAPLVNGVSVTVRAAAVNAAGMGPWSAASAQVVPDVFEWSYSGWANCSAPCNGGTQKRAVTCVDHARRIVPDARCPTARPTDLSKACNTALCLWSLSAWTACSRVCGGGSRTRTVGCMAPGGPSPVLASLCSAPAPVSVESCNTHACAVEGFEWRLGPWSACSDPCNGGTQSQQVGCHSQSTGSSAPAGRCPTPQPASSRACHTQLCQWRVGEFGGCNVSCGVGTRNRTVACTDGARLQGSERCSLHSPRPASEQACDTGVACPSSRVPPSPLRIARVQPGDGSLLVHFIVADAAPLEHPTTYAARATPLVASQHSTGLRAVALESASGVVHAFGTSSPIQLAELTNGQEYRVSLVAASAAGEELAEWLEPVAPVSLPAAPTITSVELLAGTIVVHFAVHPPSAPGLSPPPVLTALAVHVASGVTVNATAAAGSSVVQLSLAAVNVSAERGDVRWDLRLWAENVSGRSSTAELERSWPKDEFEAAQLGAATHTVGEQTRAGSGGLGSPAIIGMAVSAGVLLLLLLTAGGVALWWKQRRAVRTDGLDDEPDDAPDSAVEAVHIEIGQPRLAAAAETLSPHDDRPAHDTRADGRDRTRMTAATTPTTTPPPPHLSPSSPSPQSAATVEGASMHLRSPSPSPSPQPADTAALINRVPLRGHSGTQR